MIGEVLIAATSHLKKRAITINNIDEALRRNRRKYWARRIRFRYFNRVGKRPMTRNLVEVVEAEEKPAEA